MNILEKEIEDIIFSVDLVKLRKAGLNIHGKRLRQLRIGNYGIADLVTVSREKYYEGDPSECIAEEFLNITVYELKQKKIDIDCFMQAVRYAKGIVQYLTEERDFFKFKINITLIGSKIDMRSGFVYLSDLINVEGSPNYCTLNNLSLCTYQINIDGLNFKNYYDYCLTDTGFKKRKKNE